MISDEDIRQYFINPECTDNVWVRANNDLLTELLQRREQDRWIPVEEALPEGNGHCFCWILGGDGKTRWETIRCFSYGRWMTISETVTHWRPLPNPPEEKE